MTYLEPLYQDNAQEVIRLNKRDFEYKGQKIPSRVYEVAQAYKVGILKYLSEEEMKDWFSEGQKGLIEIYFIFEFKWFVKFAIVGQDV